MPDIDQPGGGGVFMAIGMVVTSLSALAAGLFSWLGSRDKLQHDAEVVRLRALVETTATRVAVLEGERDDLRRQLQELYVKLSSRGEGTS